MQAVLALPYPSSGSAKPTADRAAQPGMAEGAHTHWPSEEYRGQGVDSFLRLVQLEVDGGHLMHRRDVGLSQLHRDPDTRYPPGEGGGGDDRQRSDDSRVHPAGLLVEPRPFPLEPFPSSHARGSQAGRAARRKHDGSRVDQEYVVTTRDDLEAGTEEEGNQPLARTLWGHRAISRKGQAEKVPGLGTRSSPGSVKAVKGPRVSSRGSRTTGWERRDSATHAQDRASKGWRG